MSATGGLETAPARIISPAVVPTKPSRPKKGMIVFLVFAISLMLGLAVAFIRESTKNTVRNVADVEEKLKLPLLGTVPLLKGNGRKRTPLGNVYFDTAQPGFKEAIRNVRTSIALDNTESPHKVIMIASSTSGEGKSTVAVNLAHSFAQGEKTLLLDTDMRRPSIGQALKVHDDRPGLAQLLAGNAKLSECVHHGKNGYMDLLLPGDIPSDPSQLLSSERLINALMVLRRHYDRIIIDTPPILPVSDGLILAMHVDTVIFVAKSDATSIGHIKQALDLLLRVNARVTGIVVNKLDIRKARKYSNFGYSGYYAMYKAPRTMRLRSP
jgi:succinoglycan biosynthesis transport protein ExoP